MSRHVSTASFQGSSAAELQAWLECRGVDTRGYGTGLSKTVQELLDELQLQESSLVDEACGGVRPPDDDNGGGGSSAGGCAVRVVQVVSLCITNSDGLALFEEKQVGGGVGGGRGGGAERS